MQKQTTIANIMTKEPVTIQSTESVSLACEILEKKKFRHLPVIDSNGVIVGILSDRDARNIRVATEMVDSILDNDNNVRSALSIEEVMSKSPSCIPADQTIEQASQMIIDTRVGALPVVENMQSKKLVGIVSYLDLLQWYVKNC